MRLSIIAMERQCFCKELYIYTRMWRALYLGCVSRGLPCEGRQCSRSSLRPLTRKGYLDTW